VDAGASSCDDNHLHGKSKNDKNTTSKSKFTVDDHSDSGESEENWNESSSSGGSDHEGSSGDDEGTVAETATEEDTDGDSDASDGEMSDGADEVAVKEKKNSNNRKRKGAGDVSMVTKAKKPRTRVYWNDDMVGRFLLSFCINYFFFFLPVHELTSVFLSFRMPT